MCTGATCLKNAGDLAIGILVWGFGKASNASLIGMLLSFSLITSSRPFPPLILRILGSTIDGVYGGKGGSITNPPADASSNGGDAAGVYGLGQVILTSLNTTVSTLLCFYLFPLLFVLYNLVLFFFDAYQIRNVFGGDGASFPGGIFLIFFSCVLFISFLLFQ